MSDSLLARDSARGNILEVIEKLEKRVRELEVVGGGTGGGTTAGVTGAVTASDTVSVSANDTLAGYLDAKLVASSPVTLTQQNDGANESLLVSIAPHLIANAHHNWPLEDGDIPVSIVRVTRSVTAGAGLTGGGSLAADRIFNIGAGVGITVNADDVSLTTPGTLSTATTNSAAGNHTHAVTASNNPGAATSLLKTDASGQLIVELLETPFLTVSGQVDSSLIPGITDTYDLGSATKLWRKGWLSELESILFVENTVQVTGGWLMIPHATGTLPVDVADTDTSIDFGAAMTPDDFILMRSSLAVEYLQVGTLVSGTTYNVTRNLDGTGANDWPAGHVFVVLGNTGDGRIELDAQTAGPRISVLEQKAVYNDQVERVRIGDLAGWGSLTGYGIAIGIPGSDRLTYDPTNGLVIAGEGSGVTNIDGGNIQTNTVTATQLTATAIDSMTVTGATIRTAASGARIEINSSRIFGTDGTTDQWEALTTDGKLTAGGGDVTLDEDGITVLAGATLSTQNTLKWKTSGGTETLSIGADSSGNAHIKATNGNLSLGAGAVGLQLSVSETLVTSSLDIRTDSAGLRVGTGIVVGRSDIAPTARQVRLYHSDDTFVGQLSVDANYLRLNQDSGKSVYANGTLHTQGGLNAVTGMTLGAFSVPIANEFRMYNGATLVGQLSVIDTTWLRINQSTGKHIYTPQGIAIGGHLAVGHTNIGSAGDISYAGTLRSRKNSTYYDGYIVIPLAAKLTSTAWDGDAKTAANSGVIDLSAVFGAPGGIKAVLVRLAARSTTLDLVAALGPNSSNLGMIARTNVVSRYTEMYGLVACDSNGDIYFYSSGNLDNVFVEVFGYAI